MRGWLKAATRAGYCRQASAAARSPKQAVQASATDFTPHEIEALKAEQMKVLTKAEELLNRKSERGNKTIGTGALRIGKDLCRLFGLESPERETAALYLQTIRKHLPKLRKYQADLQEEENRKNALEDAKRRNDKMWESEYSCFRRTPELKIENAKLRKMYDNFIVIDFETTIVGAHKRKASPFTSENRVVYTASIGPNEKKGVVTGPFDTRTAYRAEFPDLTNIDCIVGHNVKFDLLYIWDNPQLKEFFRKGGVVWDTMYGEYVRNGHKESRLSLDALSLLYGGELKDHFISEQWARGICTSEIDETRMREYAACDVENTRLIYLSQLNVLSEGDRLPLVHSHMEGLLATTEMEYNGMFINEKKALEIEGELTISAQEMDNRLAKIVPAEVAAANARITGLLKDGEVPIVFNWGSAAQLRSYMFGGLAKYKKSMADPAKDGRYKIQDVEVDFPGIVPDEWKAKYGEKYQTPTGQWKVSDDVIQKVADSYPDEEFTQPIQLIQEAKKKKKLASYLSAFAELRDDNGIVHPQLNHTITRTGRLSSANPNMQNIPRTGVKDCIESRFADGNAGVMVESDYSQLEVFVNALLSQDEALMTVLEEGADLHCKRLAAMQGKDYMEVLHLCKVEKDPFWTAMRTKAKVFSFQRQYGASIKTISEETGLSIEDVEKLATTEDELYPAVKLFFDRVTKALKDTCEQTGWDVGYYDAPSGNRWYFDATTQKRRGAGTKPSKEFRRQLVLNHPVQGFAAEIVLTCLGRLWREFVNSGNFSKTGDFSSEPRALMVNTVHDCVWVDCRTEVEEKVKTIVDRCLADVKTPYVEKGYSLEKWVQFKTDTHSGRTMADV